MANIKRIKSLEEKVSKANGNKYVDVTFEDGVRAYCWAPELMSGIKAGDTVDAVIESSGRTTKIMGCTKVDAPVTNAPAANTPATTAKPQSKASTPASAPKNTAKYSQDDLANENLAIYNRGRAVPQEALKPIGGGRLKGMTNINSMWRIKKLTELFGPMGFGWKLVMLSETVVPGHDGEQVVNTRIALYVKVDGVWSEPIEGSGGAKLVVKETGGLFTDDEAFKKAFTDALSVACKFLGIGADVYFEQDCSKYD